MARMGVVGMISLQVSYPSVAAGGTGVIGERGNITRIAGNELDLWPVKLVCSSSTHSPIPPPMWDLAWLSLSPC